MRTPLASFIGTAALALALAAAPGTAKAEILGTTLIANAGQSVLFGAADPTDPDRMLLAGRTGQILVLDLPTGQINSTAFLQVPDVSTLGSEGGLLGLALDPDYANNGHGYIHYTTAGGAYGQGVSRIARFTRNPSNPEVSSIRSITPVLSFDQPQGNHNAGWIGFGPNDGYLYIATGDGGGGDDNDANHTPGVGNAQDLTNNLLGKMLRIDVDGDDFPSDGDRNYAIPADNPFVGVTGDDEIWAYGLRNPFRNSFDRETGDLWIADVGQNVREEINFQPADSTGGEDYGWRLREGTIATPSGGVGGANPDAVDPVYEYFHGSGSFQGNSVTGGVVYRGPDQGLNGRYLFADFVSSNYWSFDPADPAGTVENINGDLAAGSADNGPVAFFEDLEGNVYIATISGNILRVDTTPPGDYDGDGFVTLDDLDAWAARYGGQDLSADGNGDGVVDAADYVVWRNNLPPQEPSDAVPEPATLGLIVLGSLIAASNRRPPAA